MPTDHAEVLAQIDSLIRLSVGEFGPDLTITTDSTFQDLGLESLDIVTLAGRVQAHYGWTVNFAQYAAEIDVNSIMNLQVGSMVDYIVDALNSSSAEASSP